MSKALWAAAGASVLVGAGIVASRYALVEVLPLTLAMIRYAIGFACLAPFALKDVGALFPGEVAGIDQPPHGLRIESAMTSRSDIVALAALGIGQFGVLIALLNFGLRHVGAAQAAFIFSLFPLLTMVLSAVLGRERITALLLGGVTLSIAGVALALSPRLAAASSGHWWGELAVAASALTGAICTVLYRPYLQRYPTVPVSAFAMLASVIALAFIAIGEGWPSRIFSFSAQAWGAMLFIGVSSGIGYFWWLYALKNEAPTRVTVFLALNPVTATLLGWLLLGESVQVVALPALVLIALGLGLATRGAR
ncbi:MAG: DMT family transporter [Pseudomonadota bacterium]